MPRTVSTYLPDDLKKQLDDTSSREGRSPSQLLQTALAFYLALPPIGRSALTGLVHDLRQSPDAESTRQTLLALARALYQRAAAPVIAAMQVAEVPPKGDLDAYATRLVKRARRRAPRGA